jgi:hypothetical protein
MWVGKHMGTLNKLIVLIFAMLIGGYCYAGPQTTNLSFAPIANTNTDSPTLPVGATGAANVLNSISSQISNSNAIASNVNNNTMQLTTETHVALTSMTAAAYQNIASCPNGGAVTGTVTGGSGYLIYYCLVPIYPWYMTSTNSAYSFYQSEAKAFVSWTNPVSNVSELVTTSPTYRNGLSPTTFVFSTCYPYVNNVVYGNSTVNMGIGAAEADTTGSASLSGTVSNGGVSKSIIYTNTQACIGSAQTHPTIVARMYPGQTVTVTQNFSGVLGISDPSKSGVSGAASSTITSGNPNGVVNSTSCTASYTLTQSSYGTTVYMGCCPTVNSNVASYSIVTSATNPGNTSNMFGPCPYNPTGSTVGVSSAPSSEPQGNVYYPPGTI